MGKEVWVAKDSVLRSKEYGHWLAKRMKELRITRMGGFIFLLQMLIEHLQAGGIVRNATGAIIEFPNEVIEAAYGDDVSFTWNSAFQTNFAHRLPLRRAKRSLLPRLRLWDAALRIHDKRYF